VQPFSEEVRRGDSTMSVADDKTKSDTVIGAWRSKMTKVNWVGGLNA
jgi:hypothetical protein